VHQYPEPETDLSAYCRYRNDHVGGRYFKGVENSYIGTKDGDGELGDAWVNISRFWNLAPSDRTGAHLCT